MPKLIKDPLKEKVSVTTLLNFSRLSLRDTDGQSIYVHTLRCERRTGCRCNLDCNPIGEISAKAVNEFEDKNKEIAHKRKIEKHRGISRSNKDNCEFNLDQMMQKMNRYFDLVASEKMVTR